MVDARDASQEGFETVDHTADAGLRVRARSLEGLFLHAAEGLAWLLSGGRPVVRRKKREFVLRGIDLEELLVAWLNEILFCREAEGLIFGWFEIAGLERPGKRAEGGGQGGYELRARAEGERIDPRRHAEGMAIKAATYHDLRLREEDEGGYDVRIIFDT